LKASATITVLILLALVPHWAEAKIPRSSAAKAEFERASPCPATGEPRGACPGYVIDHIKPLCAGGPDNPSNMQWQTIEAAKLKDRDERRQCQAFRR
jgi:hypothetical protein